MYLLEVNQLIVPLFELMYSSLSIAFLIYKYKKFPYSVVDVFHSHKNNFILSTFSLSFFTFVSILFISLSMLIELLKIDGFCWKSIELYVISINHKFIIIKWICFNSEHRQFSWISEGNSFLLTTLKYLNIKGCIHTNRYYF